MYSLNAGITRCALSSCNVTSQTLRDCMVTSEMASATPPTKSNQLSHVSLILCMHVERDLVVWPIVCDLSSGYKVCMVSSPALRKY